ncbi:hypothetical protein AN957_05365 [Cytobacillus solani]|uniref:DUF418 domain-containing protein n=2 Tax=Cytobacillus solani TaxID=1637975 RepID=A0A0Q3QJT5_9BACI|nr:hypothetical protein AMS60_23125 [Bacillus sp. FJAT-21945]KQL18097.1 hypothetical protein AN957_05365 [Cytobacillus solani]
MNKGEGKMKQRLGIIDGIRGFSLIGILMANMLIFQYGIWGMNELEHFKLFVGDEAANIWVKVFVEGSFMPIFMFLFGYSMIKMKEKLEENGGKVKRHFARRFFLLIVLGLLHSTFVWEGDILFSYGCLGLLMMIFLNRKKKTIFIWAVTLLILTSFIGFGNMMETPEEAESINSYVQKANLIYADGSYSEIKDFRNSGEDPLGLPPGAYFFIILLTPFMLCPLFLLGMYAAKMRWFTQPKEERKLYVCWASILVPIGLLLKSIPYLLPNTVWAGVAEILGAPLLAIGYIFAFALLYAKGVNPVFLKLFENVGRLSMTNYLLQSIICTTIFYGYGFGLFGQIGVINGILLAIAIYGIQVITSHFYLKVWKVGPFEKLMRIGTYLKWSGNTKKKAKPVPDYPQVKEQI